MKYDAFVNEVVNHLTDEGLIHPPRPIVIDGKTYYDDVWFISFHKKDDGRHYANFCASKVVEKTENTNPVLAMLRNMDSTESAYGVDINVAYANDISNFYPVKVFHIYISVYVKNDGTLLYSTNTKTTYNIKADNYKKNGYPMKDQPLWTTTTNGYGKFVKRQLVSEGVLVYKDEYEFVSSMPLFNTSYGAYEYFVILYFPSEKAPAPPKPFMIAHVSQ